MLITITALSHLQHLFLQQEHTKYYKIDMQTKLAISSHSFTDASEVF